MLIGLVPLEDTIYVESARTRANAGSRLDRHPKTSQKKKTERAALEIRGGVKMEKHL